MANFVRTANRICRVVRLRRTLLNWLEKARFSSRHGEAPSGVPSGHVAVYVGGSSRRFVVRATYLNHPLFVKLLTEAEEEFGFDPNGPLKIPCDESAFEDAIRIVSGSVVDIIHRVTREEFPPLLQGFVQQPVC